MSPEDDIPWVNTRSDIFEHIFKIEAHARLIGGNSSSKKVIDSQIYYGLEPEESKEEEEEEENQNSRIEREIDAEEVEVEQQQQPQKKSSKVSKTMHVERTPSRPNTRRKPPTKALDLSIEKRRQQSIISLQTEIDSPASVIVHETESDDDDDDAAGGRFERFNSVVTVETEGEDEEEDSPNARNNNSSGSNSNNSNKQKSGRGKGLNPAEHPSMLNIATATTPLSDSSGGSLLRLESFVTNAESVIIGSEPSSSTSTASSNFGGARSTKFSVSPAPSSSPSPFDFELTKPSRSSSASPERNFLSVPAGHENDGDSPLKKKQDELRALREKMFEMFSK